MGPTDGLAGDSAGALMVLADCSDAVRFGKVGIANSALRPELRFVDRPTAITKMISAATPTRADTVFETFRLGFRTLGLLGRSDSTVALTAF